ncbi:hypothetical protein ACSBR1_030466 [Camellia fascicularis]
MESRSWIYVFVVAIIGWSIAVWFASETKELVLNLDGSNFHEAVAKHDFIVVHFYVPWCRHCQKFTPEYEKVASLLSSHDPQITLAKVNVDDEKNRGLASEFKISGYPTIKIFRNGGNYIQDYEGPRDAKRIVAYLKVLSGSASAEIEDSTEDYDFDMYINVV